MFWLNVATNAFINAALIGTMMSESNPWALDGPTLVISSVVFGVGILLGWALACNMLHKE